MKCSAGHDTVVDLGDGLVCTTCYPSGGAAEVDAYALWKANPEPVILTMERMQEIVDRDLKRGQGVP